MLNIIITVRYSTIRYMYHKTRRICERAMREFYGIL